MVSATAQRTVPRFEIIRCDTVEFWVDQMPGDEYTWDLYGDPKGNFAYSQGDMESAVYFEDGMYRGSAVRVVGLPKGSYFLRIMAWDEIACTNNLMLFQIDVVDPPPPEVTGDSLCVGDVPLVKIVFTGRGPWDFEYAYSDGVNTVNLNGHTDDPEIVIPLTSPLVVGESTFWIMEVTDACEVISYEVNERPRTGIVIYAKPTNSKIYVKDD